MSWHIHEVYSGWFWYILMSIWHMIGIYLVDGWMHLFMVQVVWHRLVHGWCTCLCWQIDIYWGFLSHIIWCWECKISISYRAGSLVELYSIQLLLKNPQIEVHNKKKNCTYILCSLCSLWRWFVDDILLICWSENRRLTCYAMQEPSTSLKINFTGPCFMC